MKYKYIIQGMTCGACQSHLQNDIEKLKGMNSVNVSLLQNSMDVDFDETQLSLNDIEKAVKKSGYKAVRIENAVTIKNKKDRTLASVITSFVLMLILMYFSMGDMWHLPLPPFLSGMENAFYNCILQIVITIPVVIINFHYFTNGFKRLFKLSPNMDSLIALGATSAIVYGIFACVMLGIGKFTNNEAMMHQYAHSLYIDSAAMILSLVSLGKYLETLSKKRTTLEVEKLCAMAPKKARILVDGEEQIVDIAEIKVGDVIVAKLGDVIPVDGTVVSGTASINQANITGESMPVSKKADESVYSGTNVIQGYIEIRAEKVGEDSSINTIIKLVQEAANSKAPISKLVDKVSLWFVPTIIAISLLTLLINGLVHKDFELAFNFAISVIVIACPCALGLATPLSIMVGSGIGAKNGLLIKNAEILEKAHNIKTIVLDKTGTITKGKPEVTNIEYFDNEQDADNMIYALESKSNHPLAFAICDYSKDRVNETIEVSDYSFQEGTGLFAKYNKDEYYLGNVKNKDLKITKEQQEVIDREIGSAKTVLVLAKNSSIQCIISIFDQIKETSKLAINHLTKMGIKTIMLTGDNDKTASIVAKEVGVESYVANVLPKDKQDIIKSYKKDDKHLVAMVGDGVNDAPALMAADLGIAIGAGSDLAIESSDIILQRNDLLDVVNAVRLSKRTMTTIAVGLFWALFYNCICVFLASGILYPSTGLQLNPMIASAAMSCSSLFVVMCALSINLFKPIQKVQESKISDEYTLICPKMMCVKCRARITDALNKTKGVKSFDIDLVSKEIVVHTNGKIRMEKIITALNKAGYDAFEKTTDEILPDKYEINIPHMMCIKCEAKVKAALDELKGVKSYDINLETKDVTINTNGSLKYEDLELAINKAGYEITKREEKEIVEEVAEIKEEVKMTEFNINVPGMMCVHCKAHVAKALDGVKGVKSYEINLETKDVHIVAEDSVKLEAIVKAVTEAGYEVK